jgi:molybdopterin converting factor small subunit
MKVQFELYGILRGIIGSKETTIDVSDGVTIKDAVDSLIQKSDPSLGQYIKPYYGGYGVRFSVDGKARQDDYVLAPNDIIKLLVPLSGG